jgi:hypothetical protein
VTDGRRLAFGHVLQHLVPLRTNGGFRELSRIVAEYPTGLGRRLIDDAARGWEIPAPRLGNAVRGDATAAATYLLEDARRVLRIVYALNERWELPHWKWLPQHAAALTVAPPDLVDRLHASLLEPDLVAAARHMAALARDVLALVSDEIETSAARDAVGVRLAALDRVPRAR